MKTKTNSWDMLLREYRNQNKETKMDFTQEEYKRFLDHAKKELEHHKEQRNRVIETISAYSEKLTKINAEITRCDRQVNVYGNAIDEDDDCDCGCSH